MLYIGLMSGTSADSIDGVLVDVSDSGFRVLETRCGGFSRGVKEQIEAVIRDYPQVDRERLRQLDEALAGDFARVALELARHRETPEPVFAIGSHGQTIYHGPGDDPPVTVQLGSPRRIADLTRITTVGDFRSNDLRHGGQGAPLAPGFHNAMFRDREADRAIINIGGIANVTLLPADHRKAVLGFDTGPGNTLMDRWCALKTGRTYDDRGEWAESGRAADALVDVLLGDSYFMRPPPKSTGREYFHLDWMRERYPQVDELAAEDVQAALLELTARSIIEALDRVHGSLSLEIYLCGGGARNRALRRRLSSLDRAPVEDTSKLGLPPQWVEACAFAWLAHRRIHERPGNLPSVTGASSEVLLGDIYTPGPSVPGWSGPAQG